VKIYCILDAQMASFDIDEADRRLLDLLQVDASRSNQALAEAAFLSPATCLRRVRRLRELGLIEREVAILNPQRLASVIGHGLTALVELTLERQGNEHLDALEQHLVADPAVQQCYRVSPGPDFVLVVHVPDMPAYLALSRRLFTADLNVRNVKTYFSTRRGKFEPRLPLAR
jgi:Lrp/AsnC family transcriptional regulator, leucine-responsive regulatory protein